MSKKSYLHNQNLLKKNRKVDKKIINKRLDKKILLVLLTTLKKVLLTQQKLVGKIERHSNNIISSTNSLKFPIFKDCLHKLYL